MMARALVAAGSRVVLVGRTKDTLLETADELGHESTRVCVADVAEPESVSGLVAELADEQVTVLVNNAGIGGPVRPITEIEPGEWDEVFATNVRSVYLMSRAFLPGMVAAGGGDIVNLASVSGKRPLVRRTPYTASKMAVIGLTRTLAAEVGEFGIRVNSIHPYSIETPMVEKEAMMAIFAKYPQYLPSFSPMPFHPVNHQGKRGLQEFMTPEEVSDVVAWLAGDGSATISGSQIAVDRGTMKY